MNLQPAHVPGYSLPEGFRPATPEDKGWITEAHAGLYAANDGFDDSFGVLVGAVLERFFAAQDPGGALGIVALGKAGPLGTIFCAREDAQTARLRLFLLLPEARGQGLGRALHDLCIGFARQAGYRRMVLSTHESHHAACRLYARNGWQRDSARPVHSFGQDLVELAWSRTL